MKERLEQEGDNILKRFITADEAWLYHYDPTIKQQSSEWKYPSSSTPKKAKTEIGWRGPCMPKIAGSTPALVEDFHGAKKSTASMLHGYGYLAYKRSLECPFGFGVVDNIKFLIQFCVDLSQVHPSRKKTECQDYIVAIGIHLYGVILKCDTKSWGM
ncbi:hypothetical protein TNCV_3057111 [Trichonephila clavipes]|nr:hypothetical protein TNCV_3057111 [Trichonephila clavipes]